MSEMKRMHKVRHENVVTVFGLTHEENIFGIVMEYMCYGSLDRLLVDTEVLLSPLLRYRMSYDIACGIAHLHTLKTERRCVHGDIKLENVLVSCSLQCKITDFGGAKIAPFTKKQTLSSSNSETDNSSNQYTFLYAAPELLHDPSKTQVRANDVYSFGVITMELIGWKRPEPQYWKLYVESIKANNLPKLDEIDLVKQIRSKGDTHENAIINKLICVSKACRKYARKDRKDIKDVKDELKKLWNDECDERQLKKDIQKVQTKLDKLIDDKKEKYSFTTLTNSASQIFQDNGSRKFFLFLFVYFAFIFRLHIFQSLSVRAGHGVD